MANVGLRTVLALILGGAVWSAAAQLGVNYNGVFSQINGPDLERTGATLVRGFVDYHQARAAKKNLAADPAFQGFAGLRTQGKQTILNLKFDFEGRNLPVGASAIRRELAFLDKLLPAVYPAADILVCGNEPFIESKIDQRDGRLVAFYEAVALRVKAFRDAQSRKVPLYIGAFNNLWKPSWQSPAASALLAFAQSSSWLAGIDLHIHHVEYSDIDGAFEYVSPRLRPNQKIIVTEFSLKNEWKLHLRDPIPEVLTRDYRRPASWEVYQYLNAVIHRPASRAEWVAFLQRSPWFESRKDYLTIAWRKFSGYDRFLAATYGMYQNAPKTFTPKTDPWIINPLFVNQTVVPDPVTGRPQANYVFLEEFRAILRSHRATNPRRSEEGPS